MKRLGPTLRRMAIVAMVIALAGSMFGFRTLYKHVSAFEIEEHYNPVWIVNQIEFEVLRFDDALRAFRLGEVTADDVRLRFDILWSRTGVVSSGRVKDVILSYPSIVSAVKTLKEELKIEDPVLQSLRDGDIATAERLGVRFARIRDEIHRLTLEVLDLKTRSDAAARDHFEMFTFWTRLLALGTTASLIAFVIFAWNSAERARRHADEQERLLIRARAASDAKSQFTSVVNHELRTPLTSIKGGLGLILGGACGALPEKAERVARIAYENCERLGLIINDLLDLEKLEAGEMKFDFQRTSAPRILASVMQSNDEFANLHGITLRLDKVAEDAEIYADSSRMEQVLTNIVSNAIKFSARGKEVRLGVSQCRGQVEFTVADDGCGIPEGAVDSVFDMFTQVDSTSKRAKGGTGLGLGIARSITEKHGGAITLESRLGEGTTFRVTLPAYSSEPAHDLALAETAGATPA